MKDTFSFKEYIPDGTDTKIRALVFTIAIVFANLATPALTEAATYYVSNEGSDKNAGTSWLTAWRTLVHAGNQVKAGDSVIVRSGIHPYRYLPIKTSGNHRSPIIFKGEDPENPPLISAHIPDEMWRASTIPGVWTTKALGQVGRLKINNLESKRATTKTCKDGDWYWDNNTLYFRDSAGNKHADWIWVDKGGGINIGKHSWIIIDNFRVWGGMGAGISIRGGSNNIIRNVDIKWHWRGINIVNGHKNQIQNVAIHVNKEGIYLEERSSNNRISECFVTHNGNPPYWKSGDRHAVAIGGNGPNVANSVENCEIAFNGGPPEAVALIAYDAPETVFNSNHVHNNYGSGILATIKSDNTVISGNTISNNGSEAVADGHKGIFALGVRGSRGVSLKDNILQDNQTSSGSLWTNRDREPRGAIDIRRAGPREDMSNITIHNNRVFGTQGGPDIYVSRDVKRKNLTITPSPK